MDEEILDENIIKLLGLENLPDEKKISMLEKMTDLIQKRLTIRILDKISGQDKEQFEKLIDENDAQKINEFLAIKVPDVAEIMEEEIKSFKKEAKELVENLRV